MQNKPKHLFIYFGAAITLFLLIYVSVAITPWLSTVNTSAFQATQLLEGIAKRTPSSNEKHTDETKGRKKILIISAGRSASSTVAHLIAKADSSAIYWFEPGHGIVPATQKLNNITTVQITRDMFNCGSTNRLAKITPFVVNGPCTQTTEAYFRCKRTTPSFNCLEEFQQTCNKSKLIIIKYIRIDMKTATSLLSLDSQIKMIYLIRNPAQRYLSHFKTFTTDEPYFHTCKDQLEDLSVVSTLPKSNQSRIKIVRTEDVTGEMGDPEKTRKEIFEHLELSETETVREWHKQALNCSFNGDFTNKCKRSEPLKWESLNSHQRKYVETLLNDSSCHSLSSLFDY